MIVGAVCLITINTLLYGFVTWLPVFFIKQGLSIATSFGYSLLMALGAPVGSAIGALTADRWGRKPTIIGASLISVVLGIIYPMISDPVLLPAVGFALTVPIYVLVALLFGIYIPELFPTEVRLRASGIVNTLGRGATIVTPFLVVIAVRGARRRRRDGADDRAAGRADHHRLGARHRAAAPQPGRTQARRDGTGSIEGDWGGSRRVRDSPSAAPGITPWNPSKSSTGIALNRSVRDTASLPARQPLRY